LKFFSLTFWKNPFSIRVALCPRLDGVADGARPGQLITRRLGVDHSAFERRYAGVDLCFPRRGRAFLLPSVFNHERCLGCLARTT